MTKKLYNEDPYKTTCMARVVSIEGNNVVVDQTVLFAFSGGQATDKGTIGGIQVKEAKDGDQIVYTLEQTPTFKQGDTVEIVVDAQNRDILRRLHSAAHLVAWLFEQKTGVTETIGSNVDNTKARLDYLHPTPITPLLPELQQKTNEFNNKGHQVKRYLGEDGKTLWWECEQIKMPCSGTHVRNTSEIGNIILKRKNIGKGKERIEVLLA
ncbi:alanyl-tRNA editing protein [Candidatus Woesearchaeota archaeon]|nr:alanyl-tRNA editing protein [Candidatus Woesearchaeota archaeon]